MDQPTINAPQGAPASGGAPAPGSQNEPAPFEMPPNLTPPEPMGGKGTQGQGGYSNSAPVSLPTKNVSAPPGPPKPINAVIIMLALVAVLLVGMVLFADFKGWLKIGIFGKVEPTPPITISPKTTVGVSPSASPIASSSPVVSTNVNDETRKKDLTTIKGILDKYYLANSKYPVSTTASKTSDKTGILYAALVPIYAESLPDDPLAPQYYYGYKSDGATFEITCILEDKSDTSGTLVNSMNIYKVTNLSVD